MLSVRALEGTADRPSIRSVMSPINNVVVLGAVVQAQLARRMLDSRKPSAVGLVEDS